MKDGFLKVAAASPLVRVGDARHNAEQIVQAAWRASTEGVQLLVTPELGVTGYTCGDLFGQQTLLAEARAALETICAGTADLQLVLVVGLPLQHRGKLYNCAAVLAGGSVLGVVPKSHLPGHGEFYEPRNFAPAFDGIDYITEAPLQGIAIGRGLLFRCQQMPSFTLGVEICEDLWVPQPPSTALALAGATVIANLSASNETVSKADYRRLLVQGQSARLVCGYVYADAGKGESTTDMVFAGHNLIAENGVLLDESPLFSGMDAAVELDLDRLLHERQCLTSYPAATDAGYYTIYFDLDPVEAPLTREISPMPFIPEDDTDLASRCETILTIQAAGLAKRLAHTNAKAAVLGISGGLDSSLALLVSVRALAAIGRSTQDVVAVTMPGFGTTGRTLGNAQKLCQALDIPLLTVDVTNSVRAHFADIGHDEAQHDLVYENAQARMRTLVLMDIANQRGGLVVGTGDLSELALGWATYNGDHMSMYAPNASVPKTLIRHLIIHEAMKTPSLSPILHDILDTPVSPELLPPEGDEIAQHTEQLVGPYELHDFFLY